MTQLRIGFAGDRDIAVQVMQFLRDQGVRPELLMIPEAAKASHAQELRTLCAHLPDDRVLIGRAFREDRGLQILRSLRLDYMIGIHFAYLVPPAVLDGCRIGFLNLHPAYLPYNRGWHTPSWAILDGTPAGATLHFMDQEIDRGDIVHQRQLEVRPNDTANTLYARIKSLELEVFKEVWPRLVNGDYQRARQPREGTVHTRQDLFTPQVQEISLDRPQSARELLRQLRALTTSRADEAAYFVEDGKKYRVQISIHETDPD